MANKLYVVTYHEVQIAGYRIFTSYDEALKEYLKHCIIETQTLLLEDEDEPIIEQIESDSDEVAGEDEAAEDEDEDDEFDEMSCVLEIQELQGNEFLTVKEFDYESFEKLLDARDDVSCFLTELEKQIEDNEIPNYIVQLFK